MHHPPGDDIFSRIPPLLVNDSIPINTRFVKLKATKGACQIRGKSDLHASLGMESQTPVPQTDIHPRPTSPFIILRKLPLVWPVQHTNQACSKAPNLVRKALFQHTHCI